MSMKQIWGVLAAGTMLSLAQAASADVKAGVDAWQQGDYARAVAVWQPLAQSGDPDAQFNRSEEHTSELQSLMRISYAVFCLKKKKKLTNRTQTLKSITQTRPLKTK